ncbi:MAG TPA: DUF2279 domain-containing protein [Hanamia sp.]|nr:DUF2279 domain-containing protein [Hanamia sp.]
MLPLNDKPKKFLPFFVALLFTLQSSFAQENLIVKSGVVNTSIFQAKKQPKDSFVSYPHNKKRIHLVTAANIVGYGGALVGLNAIWYAKYPRSGFHFFNDDNEWLQMDKIGHIYSAYSESRASMELWRWAGLPRKKSIWIGGLSGVAYQSIIEVLDGFSSQYGFSPGDFVANIVGSGAFISQQLVWNDEKIQIKFSFHRKNYGSPQLNKRADDLYGNAEIQRFIKDYNGQTYWLSANIHSFFTKSKLPRWLNFSVGYGAEGMFGGTKNIGYDENGNVIFDRQDIKRYRQWYLSPDVDFTKIHTNKKGIKVLLFVLNAVKFPAPTLEFSNGKFKGHWIVF